MNKAFNFVMENWLPLGILVVGASAVYTANKAGKVISNVVTEDLNPTNPNNVVNRTVAPEGSIIDKGINKIRCLFGNDDYCPGIEVTPHVEASSGSGQTDGNAAGNFDIAPLNYEEETL